MSRNTSISLGDYIENYIERKIQNGQYKNASEVIQAGLQLLEEEGNRAIPLKNAIQEGNESGIAKNFNPKKHLAGIKRNRGKRG